MNARGDCPGCVGPIAFTFKGEAGYFYCMNKDCPHVGELYRCYGAKIDHALRTEAQLHATQRRLDAYCENQSE